MGRERGESLLCIWNVTEEPGQFVAPKRLEMTANYPRMMDYSEEISILQQNCCM